MIIDNKYTIPYTIPYSLMDGKGRCSTLSLVNLAQDLAAAHYGLGGLSIPHLQKMGLTWVITKQEFIFNNYPVGRDEMVLQTWAHEPKGLFCFRDYKYSYAINGKKPCLNVAYTDQIASEGKMPDLTIKDENLIMGATSNWMILELETGRPIKPSSAEMGTLTYSNDKASSHNFSKIALSDGWDTQMEFSPSLLDIDINSHVNNLNYVRWILSYMDYDFCKGKLVRSLETNFVNSALFGDSLICRCKAIAENICVHSIIRTDGSEVFRARTEWAGEESLSRRLRVDLDD